MEKKRKGEGGGEEKPSNRVKLDVMEKGTIVENSASIKATTSI